jgi:hypothetical protein
MTAQEILRCAQDDSSLALVVILSAAKDLWGECVQKTWLTYSCGLMDNHERIIKLLKEEE